MRETIRNSLIKPAEFNLKINTHGYCIIYNVNICKFGIRYMLCRAWIKEFMIVARDIRHFVSPA